MTNNNQEKLTGQYEEFPSELLTQTSSLEPPVYEPDHHGRRVQNES